MAGLNSLEVKSEVMRLLGDNCDQKITARELREALITVFENATGVVSPVYMKNLIGDLDEMGMDLLNHSLQVTMEDGQKELKIFDELNNVWLDVLSEQRIKEWIAASAKFEGVVAEDAHTQGTGVKQLTDLLSMLTTMTDAEKLLKVGHYFTWNGADGYIIQPADLGGELDGKIMQTNDWLQLVNSGGQITDPNDPDYATQKPDIHLVHISGDNLSKNRADGLYSFNLWHHAAYEKGSVVTYMGKVFKSEEAIVAGDLAPNNPLSKWTELDFSAVTPMTYFGNGGFDYEAVQLTSQNNWGMPAGTHPDPTKRHIHDGDRYIDLLTGEEVDFTVNQTTHVITADHTFGHTREFDITITANAGEHFELLKNMPRDTSDLTVTVEAVAPDGATYDMRYLSSEGADPLLVPVAINAHGSTISAFGGLDKGGLDHIMGTSSSDTDAAYRVIIHSEYHDIGAITLGSGATDTNAYIESIDGNKNYPITMKRNVITKNASPALGTPDYKGQVNYDEDDHSGLMMLRTVAYTDTTWKNTAIGSTKIGTTGGTQAKGILVMTQAKYDAITTKDASTLYFIEE
ncbi:hypothetical protein J7J63_05850 [Candidatus Bipolaricaulota bacterium]|nr:hypothetical protein [Candidatus Bipolaricaulota bacterium]